NNKPYGYGLANIFACSGTQLGAELRCEGRHDPRPQRGRVLVGERPFGRLEPDREGDRLLAGPDLVAAVDVERPHLTKLGTCRLAGRVHERAGGDLLVDDEREVLTHG